MVKPPAPFRRSFLLHDQLLRFRDLNAAFRGPRREAADSAARRAWTRLRAAATALLRAVVEGAKRDP
jgi:hypothetical protein